MLNSSSVFFCFIALIYFAFSFIVLICLFTSQFWNLYNSWYFPSFIKFHSLYKNCPIKGKGANMAKVQGLMKNFPAMNPRIEHLTEYRHNTA